jgi:hypothetical protein
MDNTKAKDFTSQKNSDDMYTVLKISSKTDIKTSDHKPPFVVGIEGSDFFYNLVKIPKIIKTRADLTRELQNSSSVFKNIESSAKEKIIDQMIKTEVTKLNLTKTGLKRVDTEIDSLLQKYGAASSSISKEWSTNYRIKACAFFYILQLIYFVMFDDGSRGTAAIWEYILGIFTGNTLLGISIIALHMDVFPNSSYVLSLWILCCLVIFWSMYNILSVKDNPTLNKNTKADLNDMYLYSWYEVFVSVEVFYVSAILGIILNNAPQPTEKKK